MSDLESAEHAYERIVSKVGEFTYQHYRVEGGCVVYFYTTAATGLRRILCSEQEHVFQVYPVSTSMLRKAMEETEARYKARDDSDDAWFAAAHTGSAFAMACYLNPDSYTAILSDMSKRLSVLVAYHNGAVHRA